MSTDSFLSPTNAKIGLQANETNDLTIDGESGLDPSTSADARRAFRDTLGQFCTGVTAVTTISPDDEWVGITANSFNSLSLDPPLILWSIARTTPSFDLFKAGDPFVVNVLSAAQEELAMQFAQSGADKFKNVKTHPGLRGIPIIDGCVAYLECDVEARHPGGDHDIIVGRVRRVFNLSKAPLLFHGGAFHSLPER
ncbi:MAG: flavin reductase family protein [Rhodospirillaceae bacterium]